LLINARRAVFKSAAPLIDPRLMLTPSRARPAVKVAGLIGVPPDSLDSLQEVACSA
jgi:hypothetical protein